MTAPQTTLPATLSPAHSDPQLDGDHERMSHIVLEGYKAEEGDFVAAGPSVVEGLVNGTTVRALCGKIWVPKGDPRRYPLCPTCKEIAEARDGRCPPAEVPSCSTRRRPGNVVECEQPRSDSRGLLPEGARTRSEA